MKFHDRPVLALTNLDNALTSKNNSWWPTALLVILLGWLCVPAEAHAATRDRKKPTVPTGLTATPVSCNEVSLSWTASTDTGGSGLMAYRIYRNGVLFKQVSAPATKTSDVGLSGSTRYSYAILAVDKAGNKSAKSSEVFVTTPACCNYSIVPLAASVSADGGNGSIAVTTGSGCSWSAISSATWLSISPGGAIVGNGTVTWSATVNGSTNARTGNITIGGQSFTVSQSGATPTLAPVPLADAVDNSNLNLSTGGDANWVGQTSISYNGGDSAQAGLITHSQGSWLEGTVTGPVELSFVWKVSSEQYFDFLRFSIDGVEQAGVSGEVNWQTKTFSVPAGTHTLRWNYTKDHIVSAGMDCAWVDQVRVTTSSGCNYSVTLSLVSFPDAGGSGIASVTAGTGCNWTANSAYTWIHTSSSGSGSGTATFSVDANSSTSARSGTLAIAGQSFIVTQAGAPLPCTYSLSVPGASVGAAAGSGTVNVNAGAGCDWTASSSAPGWLTCSPASGSGSAAVTWTVTANSSCSPRNGTVTIAGQSFSVSQAAGSGNYSILPTSTSIAASGGSGSVNVTAGSGCSWMVSSAYNWIRSSSSGNGNGTATYTVDPNTSTNARNGALNIAGQLFLVTQGAAGTPCTYAISASGANAGAGAGSGIVNVTAGTTCNWTASSGSPGWLTCSPANGSGASTVTWTVTANNSCSPRSGTLTIAGQSFTVSQAAGSGNYSILPTSASIAATGGGGSINVTADSGCSWTASSAYNWIRSSSGGSGNGTATFTVDANTSTNGRNGTLSIGGRSFQVTQSGAPMPCTYAISATGANAGAGAGSGTVNVTAGANCNWTASSGSPGWLTCSPANGSGASTVTWTVTANNSCTPRSGTLTIAGQSFMVSQAAGSGNYSISPSSASVTDSGGSASVSVTANSGCGWIATANNSWITITAGSAGSGNGAVGYYVSANTSTSQRSGTLNIAGQTFTVTQAGAIPTCTYSLSSYSANAGATAGSGTFNVTAGATCAWTPSSSAPSWLTCSPPTGTGSGPVTWYVTANTSTSQRSGTLTIQGQTFNVTQAGAVVSGTGGEIEWIKTMQSTAPSDALSTGVASDSAGNTIAVGRFYGTMDLGRGSVTSAGFVDDIFIVKYNPQGTPLWVKTIGNTGADVAAGVAIDGQNNIIVVGNFNGVVDFGGGPLISAGGSDIFVAKYTNNGANPPTLLWAKSFGGNSLDNGTAVAVGPNNDVFIAGWFMSMNASFGPGFTLNPAGGKDIALARLDHRDGHTLWARAYGGTETEQPTAITVDNSGNAWVGGNFFVATDLGTGPKANADPSGVSADMYLARYSGTDGRCLYARTIGGAGIDNLGGIVHDSTTDNIYITGGASSTADFGGGAAHSGGGIAGFVAGYGSAGNYLWLKTWGGSDAFAKDGANAVAVAQDGSLAVTGKTSSWINFGDGALTGAGYTTVCFTLAGNSQPVYRWAKRASYTESGGYGLAFDGLGHVVTVGKTVGGIDLGGMTAGIASPYYGAFVTQHMK